MGEVVPVAKTNKSRAGTCALCGAYPAWVRVSGENDEGQRVERTLCYRCAIAEVHQLLVREWMQDAAHNKSWEDPVDDEEPREVVVKRPIYREDLEAALEVAIACEAYEWAAQIRDWLKARDSHEASPILHWDG